MNKRKRIDGEAYVRWIMKMILRCIRTPFCVVDFLVTVVVNPNIFILLVLLFAACVTGAWYRGKICVDQGTTATTKEVSAVDTPKDDHHDSGPSPKIDPVFINRQHDCVTNVISNVSERERASQFLNVYRGWISYSLYDPSAFGKDLMAHMSENSAQETDREEKSSKGGDACFDWLNSETLQWSISRMFDYGEVLGSLQSGSLGDGVAALLLFLFTWLIGGGGLVGSIITTMKFFHEGGWRRCSLLLWNHTVILGWDDNGITVIREHIESRKFNIWGPEKQWAMPERIVVLTSRNVDEVKRRIDSYLRPRLWKNPTVRYDIYRGEYDDRNELSRLNLSHANAIYILGEESDRSHDARVLMLSQVMGSTSFVRLNKFKVWFLRKFYCLVRNKRMRNKKDCQSRYGLLLNFLCNVYNATLKKWWCPVAWLLCYVRILELTKPVRIELHLASFGLYSQLLRMKGEAQASKWDNIANRIVDVSYRNFYDSWAKRLFANYWSLVHSDHKHQMIRLKMASIEAHVHFVIIGFTEMGQALAIQAARVAHYGKGTKVYVTIFDDELERRELEFRSLFPRIDEIADIHWTFMHGEELGSESFMEKIADFSKSGDALTIAIACDNDATGMKIAIPIFNMTRHKNRDKFQILLRQNVIGRIMPKDEEAPILNVKTQEIRVFGMRDGAGYNAWFRDNAAISLYAAVKKGCTAVNRYKWCRLAIPEKRRYELPFDAMEETFDALNDNGDTKREVIESIVRANGILDDGLFATSSPSPMQLPVLYDKAYEMGKLYKTDVGCSARL